MNSGRVTTRGRTTIALERKRRVPECGCGDGSVVGVSVSLAPALRHRPGGFHDTGVPGGKPKKAKKEAGFRPAVGFC